MKNLILIGLIMVVVQTQAQNDTMYVMKAGNVINKQSIKVTDVDSIIFYKPVIKPTINIATVQIQGGVFLMGSDASETSRAQDEVQHQVTLSSFRMSKYEITNSQFAFFLNSKGIGSNGKYALALDSTQALVYATPEPIAMGLQFDGRQWNPITGFENNPVVNVTWFGAYEFAIFVGGRLPTEAEWEYACRAGTTGNFNTGSCITRSQANYDWYFTYLACDNIHINGPSSTMSVGTYSPNAWGLYEMHGNVYEWCNDWYDAYPTTPQINPTGPSTGSVGGYNRVNRGGGWGNLDVYARSARRNSNGPAHRSQWIGFRVAFAQ